MSAPDYPVGTDAEQIKGRLDEQTALIQSLNARLDRQAEGINSIGANMEWIVNNVQGIFQMFSSPQFMAQMGQMMTGGVPSARPAADPAGGTDAGGADENVLGG